MPAPVLDTMGWDWNPAGLRGQHEIDAQRAILPSALHHIVSLRVKVEKFGAILDLDFSHHAGLVDDNMLLLERLIERDETAAVKKYQSLRG